MEVTYINSLLLSFCTETLYDLPEHSEFIFRFSVLGRISPMEA